MGYKSPYNKVGKVMPEMKNQSKSSLMMNDASPLYETDPNAARKAKMRAEREATMAKREAQRVERARKADAIKERVQNRRMEQTIARDKAINERRAAVIEKRKQKDPSYKYKKEGTATGQQHFQSSVTPLEMHGPGGSHPDPKKKKATTTLKNALASDKDYQIVPGFEERLGGELEGVTLTAPAKTNKQKRQEKRAANKKERRNTYSKTGIAIKTIGSYLPGGGGKYKRRQLEKTARKGLF